VTTAVVGNKSDLGSKRKIEATVTFRIAIFFLILIFAIIFESFLSK
jgi:hypothetical protein